MKTKVDQIVHDFEKKFVSWVSNKSNSLKNKTYNLKNEIHSKVLDILKYMNGISGYAIEIEDLPEYDECAVKAKTYSQYKILKDISEPEKKMIDEKEFWKRHYADYSTLHVKIEMKNEETSEVHILNYCISE